MNRTHYILRGILLLLTILLLVYLNRKTDDNIGLIAKFKFETLNNIKGDSLDTNYKFDLLDNEATGFSGQILEDTSHVREAVLYLIGVVGLLIAAELGFFITERRRTTK